MFTWIVTTCKVKDIAKPNMKSSILFFYQPYLAMTLYFTYKTLYFPAPPTLLQPLWGRGRVRKKVEWVSAIMSLL